MKSKLKFLFSVCALLISLISVRMHGGPENAYYTPGPVCYYLTKYCAAYGALCAQMCIDKADENEYGWFECIKTENYECCSSGYIFVNWYEKRDWLGIDPETGTEGHGGGCMGVGWVPRDTDCIYYDDDYYNTGCEMLLVSWPETCD